MPQPYFTIIVAIITSGILTPIVVAIINRKQSQATVSDTLVGAAKRLVDELQEDVARLRQERQEAWDNFADYKRENDAKIQELVAELKVQENALENLATKTMKYQLALSIIVNQLRTIGLEPVIDPSDIEGMRIEDMRLIAEGFSNIERKRAGRSDD